MAPIKASKLVMLALLVAALCLPGQMAFAAEDQDRDDQAYADLQLQLAYGGPLLARAAGTAPDPRFWFLDDDELKQTMENDEELRRLFHLAYNKKHKRRRTSNILFLCGATVLATGTALGMSSKMLNIPDSAGQIALVGGAVVGLGLITPAIVLRARPSKAEREYIDYVHDKYNVTPTIDRRDPAQQPLIRLTLLQVPIP
ncbi:MAG: hypothetical protein P9M14_16575 [Candidatus Alcyoniella australis]|nr:hypothetical protein [Candidatus Alcyoniella australis]